MHSNVQNMSQTLTYVLSKHYVKSSISVALVVERRGGCRSGENVDVEEGGESGQERERGLLIRVVLLYVSLPRSPILRLCLTNLVPYFK